MRIGILIREFNKLQNWELRIIERIKNDPKLELTLLIKDGRDENDELFLNKTNLSLSNRLLNKQFLIERKRYLSNIQTVNKEELIEFLETIPVIEVNPKRKNNLDIFSNNDSQKVKKYNLDVILKHEFKIISGEILNFAKFGIWFLSHSDISLKRGGFPGFWEVLLKEPTVAVSLIKMNKENAKGIIIDKAFYNLKPSSSIITNNVIKESSVSLLLKNLRKLWYNENISTKKKINITHLYDSPNIYYTCKYILKFYS